MDLDKETRRMIREIERAPIVEPGPDQYVDVCPYSKTGWAVWNKDDTGGYCTCQPTRAPEGRK